MAGVGDLANENDIKTNIEVRFSGDTGDILKEFTVREVYLGESLLTPGLQTFVKAHSYIHSVPIKDFDKLKGVQIDIDIERPILAKFGLPSTMSVSQVVRRLDSRELINNNTEELVIRGCDQSILNDAGTLVSKSWRCASPSSIAEYALRGCAGVKNLVIERSGPSRDYVAENIHPFQVVSQQTNYALAKGDDPSFLHYMTYERFGTHHFRSLKSLSNQRPCMIYTYNDSSNAYGPPNSIMNYSFPCDFDLLTDILNGVDINGKNINSLTLFNPFMKTFSLLGNQAAGCGIGAGVIKSAISNMNSAKLQDSCPDYANVFLLKRQARMALLEKDKIALKLTVPFNPILNAGKVIQVNLYNKELNKGLRQLNYGSGKYIILNMFHHITEGGYSVTVMDCVSETAGRKGMV